MKNGLLFIKKRKIAPAIPLVIAGITLVMIQITNYYYQLFQAKGIEKTQIKLSLSVSKEPQAI